MASPTTTPRPLVECPACHAPLQTVGRLPLRRDAAEQGVIVTAQAGDAAPAIGIDVYRCHECGRLDFYDHDFLLAAS